jgi:hypothetical protein
MGGRTVGQGRNRGPGGASRGCPLGSVDQRSLQPATQRWRGVRRRGWRRLLARIDNCGAKVLFEAAAGRFF